MSPVSQGPTRIDTRELLFPMTAGDVVVSVEIAAIRHRGDGPELRLFEVVDVHRISAEKLGPDDRVTIVAKDPAHGGFVEFTLPASWPLLLTGIRR